MTTETDIADREIIAELQAGLPLVPAPYAEVASRLGMAEGDLIKRIQAMKDKGVIRRIAAAPNHYKLGMVANGMTVWDVEDARIAELGAQIGALPYVTHCYERPRAPEAGWTYNLFAMAHGDTREEVEAKRAEIAEILGDACRTHSILYSKRILKKTGLRLRKRG